MKHNINAPDEVYTGFSRGEWTLAFGLIVLALFVIFPDLFLFKSSPMAGDPQTIKDPTVSWGAFMPAFREFRYELLNHGNILWSNLRSLGQPMLGNGVQGAPLFPLNLVLVGLPDHIYWSVMPLLRLSLIGLACFALARQVFGLSFLASLVFALMAGLNLNVIRWLNHPWSNGLLAGLWYLYCCARLVQTKAHNRRLCIGLVISVFALITCGFPEASALAALMSLIIFIAVCGNQLRHGGWRHLKHPIWLISVAHVVGLSLSSVQIFALVEYVNFSDAWSLREGYISQGYELDRARGYWLSQLTVFNLGNVQWGFLVFSIGLSGLTLALLGFFHFCAKAQAGHRILGTAFIFMMALFVAKNFLLSETLESIFGLIPILAESHFPHYFSPLFYFGLAFFAALGVEYLRAPASKPWFGLILILITASVTCYCLNLYIRELTFLKFNSISAWLANLQYAKTAVVFIIMLIVVVGSYGFIKKPQHRTLLLAGLPLLALFFELNYSLVKRFDSTDHYFIRVKPEISTLLPSLASKAKLPKHELREHQSFGSHAHFGLATIDNGVSAILPSNIRRVRGSLFNTKYGGYYPLETPMYPWSYAALSTNISSISATPFRTPPDWQPGESNWQVQPRVIPKEGKNYTLMRNPLFLTGTVQAVTNRYPNPEVWLQIITEDQTKWLQANIGGITGIAAQGEKELRQIHWRMRIPEAWLEAKAYQVVIRVRDSVDFHYFDSKPFTLDLTDAPPATSQKLLASSDDQTSLFYLNEAALPRAYVASSCDYFSDKEAIQHSFASSDAVIKGHVALLTDTSDTVDCSNYQNTLTRVPIIKDSGSNIELQKIKGPALLVLNDMHYPGWQARDSLSGEGIDIQNANIAFKSIYLPDAKQYKIQFTYQPQWLNWVYLLLIFSGILSLLLFHMTKRSRFA